jgi:sugar lactone lactonase YvrE
MTRAIPILAVFLLLAGCAGDAEPEPDTQPETPRAQATDSAADSSPADTGALSVADVGLRTPESILHDPTADVYLVSNIDGEPAGKDDNGFIARIRPDGTVEELRWVDGAALEVSLHAPKGMAIHGDTLFVTDIDSVRAFHRTTGEALGARGVPDASFLNDLAVAPDGTLYVTDSGVNADFSSAGTDAVYRFDGDRAVAVAEGAELANPNGIAVADGALILVSMGAPTVRRIPLAARDSAAGEMLAELPGVQLDGVVVLEDGGLLVSSWETRSVYRIPAGGGTPAVVAEGVPSPADIGWDGRRGRLLIPVFTEDRLEIRPLRR